uniref:Knottin scorpion toxin-like domain-containing protein n=1 Tax=Daucus carota subsp. sativus TaxID=79200 RepID=A0A166FUV8_DAUCS
MNKGLVTAQPVPLTDFGRCKDLLGKCLDDGCYNYCESVDYPGGMCESIRGQCRCICISAEP